MGKSDEESAPCGDGGDTKFYMEEETYGSFLVPDIDSGVYEALVEQKEFKYKPVKYGSFTGGDFDSGHYSLSHEDFKKFNRYAVYCK